MPQPRVIFVNRFYWPEQPATAQLLTDLAESLAAAGLPVTVIASSPEKGSNLNVCGHPALPPPRPPIAAAVPLREIRHDVAIIRVPTSRFGKHSLLKRAFDFASFLRAAHREVTTLARPGDILVALTDPPLLGVALSGPAGRKNLRLIHWVQDVFPEVAMAVGHRFTALARPARDRAWRSASACVVLGTDMAALLRERAVPASRIHVIPNWAPAGIQPLPPDSPATAALRTRWGLDGKLVVAYSGNLGRVHDFTAIIPLAESLRNDTDIAFVFIGDGAQRPALEAAARERGLTNLHFHPAQPREALAATLALGDIHLVTLRAGCERLVFPSKLYGIAAVGRPVLFIGPSDCEVARVIESNRFGHAFTNSAANIPLLAATLRSLRDAPAQRLALGQAASAFCAREGRLHHATTHWHRLLTGKPLADNSPKPST